MPTSSIFSNVRITDPQKAEEFIDALDASARNPVQRASEPEIQHLTDKEEIRRFMSKRFPDLLRDEICTEIKAEDE